MIYLFYNYIERLIESNGVRGYNSQDSILEGFGKEIL